MPPSVAPGHGGAVPPPGTGRYNGFGGARADPRSLEWLPPGGLRGEQVFPLDRQSVQQPRQPHQHHQYQQYQQQRHEYLPPLGQHFVDYTPDFRSAWRAVQGGGGGSGGGDGGGDGGGGFNSRRPGSAAEFLGGQLRQQQLPRPHFGSDLNPPPPTVPAGAGHEQELVQEEEEDAYPHQRDAAMPHVVDDDGVMAEALAAVEAGDRSEVEASASQVLASLVDEDFHAARSSAAVAAGYRAGGGGGGGGGDGFEADGDGDEDRDGAGVGDGDGDGGTQGNGPVKSCCSFLALNAQENMVGEMPWPAEGREDDADDSDGAFMID